MKEINQNKTIPQDKAISFWGMMMIAAILLLVYGYALLFSEGENVVISIARVGFSIGIVLTILGAIATLRNQLEAGSKFTFYTLLAIGVMVSSLIQGRALPATFLLAIVTTIGVAWVFPQPIKRRFLVLAALALIVIWAIEWINPAWRQQTQLAQAGPIGALALAFIFAILLYVQSRQAIATSLRLKIVVWMGFIVAVLSTVLVAYSIITSRQAAIASAQAEALSIADTQARQIRADTEIPLDAARTLAHALTAVKDPSTKSSLSRDDVNAILRQVLIENPSFLGTYTLWEPDAFDGLDEIYRGQETHDETGRFIPYWVRGDDGSVSVIALEQYETPGIGDWYVLPRQNKKEMTFAPLFYPINGVDTVMASFVTPIIYGGQFYGIAGVDAPIGFVQDIVDDVDLYNGKASAALMTSSGTLISVRNRPEMVNHPAAELYPDFSEFQARLEAGEAFVSLSPDGQYLRVFAPVDLGRTGSHWAFGLVIPFSEITADATATAVREVAISAALILIALVVLWFLSGQILRPIRQLTLTANAIAQGDINAIAEAQSVDEIGILANTFNTMTTRLRETLSTLEQRVADRTRNLELAGEVSHSVSQVRDLDTMLRDATELIRSRFDLYYTQVYLTNPSQTELILQAGTGEVGEQLHRRGHRLPINTASINGRAVVEKRAVIISDTHTSATFRPNPLLPETRSEMAVPLMIGDKVVGVLDMQSKNAGALNEETLSAFSALAGQMAVAISNANLLAVAEEARAEVEAQAGRLTRANWKDYLDAINKAERVGFVYENNEIIPLVEDEIHLTSDGKTISSPIAISGEMLGSLVVEMNPDNQAAHSAELVNVVARQVAQQIENLRLLESAERYRLEAEGTTRRATIEGWNEYIEARGDASLGYLYNSNEVVPAGMNQFKSNEKSITLPLKAREETIGKLAIMGVEEQDTESLELANAVAERLSAHIENLRLLEETRRGQIELDKRARELESVAEISSVSARELDIQKMLETVVFLTQRRFGLYHAHVFTYEENAKRLKIVACGWKEGDIHEGTHGTTTVALEQEQSLVARAAREKRAVVVNDVQSDPGWLPNPLLPDTRSEMAVPLLVGDQLLGVLDVQKDYLNAFSDEDTAVVSTLATQVATALQNARSFEQAQKQAERESTLNVISQKIQSATTVEAVLQIAARELGHALGAPLTIAQLGVKNGND